MGTLFAYCTSCAEHKDTAPSIQSNRLASYCEDCGNKLKVLDEEEHRERLRENTEWPVQATISAPVRLQGDYSHAFCGAAGLRELPFDTDEYFLDKHFGSVPITIEFYEDGTHEVVEVGDL